MKKILLLSAWQDVNIGDMAHTPGLLHVLEHCLPDTEVALWPWHPLTDAVRTLLTTRFPALKIVNGELDESGKPTTQEIVDTFAWCDLLLHGSGSMLVARDRVKAFIKQTGKPYGVFGITYDGNPWFREVLDRAAFIYFRDTVSLYRAKRDGCACKSMAFGPDAAFAFDIVNEACAENFLVENGLEAGKFVCCIGRYRWTPFWEIKPGIPYNAEKDQFNALHKEQNHAPLVEAICKIVRELGMKALLCPECRSQIRLEKEMIYDRRFRHDEVGGFHRLKNLGEIIPRHTDPAIFNARPAIEAVLDVHRDQRVDSHLILVLFRTFQICGKRCGPIFVFVRASSTATIFIVSLSVFLLSGGNPHFKLVKGKK